VWLLREPRARRDFGYLAATAAFVSAFVTTLSAIKALFLCYLARMPLVAAFALHLFRGASYFIRWCLPLRSSCC